MSAALLEDLREDVGAAESDQLFLFSGEQLPKIDPAQPIWHCTGEYLRKARPDVWNAVMDALAEPGVSIRMICRAFRVSHNTVSSIQEREAANLDARKKNILGTISRGLRLCAERVEELGPTMTSRDAVIGVGVLTEKLQLLGGDPTARVEMISGPDLFGKLAELHRKFTEAIGVAGENVALKGPGAPVAVEALPSAGSDLESEVLPG
jgi:hypothetical protein